MMNDMERWLTAEGIRFLANVGMMPGQVVLDFGCKHGTYTIPAALLVGTDGRVYAIDKNKNALDELVRNAQRKRLENIVTIAVNDPGQFSLSADSVDMVLLYDVLHLVDHRKRLLATLHRVLNASGILSVYPMHHKEDMNMTIQEVKEEIESIGFYFEKSHTKTLMHDDRLVQGEILTFKKG